MAFQGQLGHIYLASIPNAVRSPLEAVLRLFPYRIVKYVVIAVVLANFHSWPLMWHLRVFSPLLRRAIHTRLFKLRTIFYSKKRQHEMEARWLDDKTLIGANPMETVSTYCSWCGPDDSDINGHMSNSSYAKVMDNARVKSALAFAPHHFRAGGMIPLAGTHFHFIREIPMLSKYELREYVAAWDNKWMFVISRFVTKPSKGGKKTIEPQIVPGQPNETESPTPSGISNSDTPFGVSDSAAPLSESLTPEAIRAMKTLAATLAHRPEEDGATLHTIGISMVCFKIGRITVPPSIALAANGFSAPPSNVKGAVNTTAYSPTNPPPHWATVRKMMYPQEGGSMRTLQAFLRGGWKDVPAGERWWEQALAPLDEQRLANLEAIGVLKQGMEAARGMHPE